MLCKVVQRIIPLRAMDSIVFPVVALNILAVGTIALVALGARKPRGLWVSGKGYKADGYDAARPHRGDGGLDSMFASTSRTMRDWEPTGARAAPTQAVAAATAAPATRAATPSTPAAAPPAIPAGTRAGTPAATPGAPAATSSAPAATSSAPAAQPAEQLDPAVVAFITQTRDAVLANSTQTEEDVRLNAVRRLTLLFLMFGAWEQLPSGGTFNPINPNDHHEVVLSDKWHIRVLATIAIYYSCIGGEKDARWDDFMARAGGAHLQALKDGDPAAAEKWYTWTLKAYWLMMWLAKECGVALQSACFAAAMSDPDKVGIACQPFMAGVAQLYSLIEGDPALQTKAKAMAEQVNDSGSFMANIAATPALPLDPAVLT